jgi:hypothetical protein
MDSISISAFVVFGSLSEFGDYHVSTIKGSVDDDFRFIWLGEGRIRNPMRVRREGGDVSRKIMTYDINGDFAKAICSFIEGRDRKTMPVGLSQRQTRQMSAAVTALMHSEKLADDGEGLWERFDVGVACPRGEVGPIMGNDWGMRGDAS